LLVVRNLPISFHTNRTAIAILSAAGVQELRIKHIVVPRRAIREGIRAFADYGPLRVGGWKAVPTPLFRKGGI